MAIIYVRQNAINYVKWDRCISNALNGSVYGLSWYLDIVAGQWDALIEGDYDFVMPLVFKKNLLFHHIYVPPLSGQLGVFSSKPVSGNKVRDFLSHIPKQFKQVHIQLNRQNSSGLKSEGKSVPLFELDLITPYDKLRRNYPPDVKARIADAFDKKYRVMKHLGYAEAEDFLRQQAKIDLNRELSRLNKIISRLIKKNRAEISGIYTPFNALCGIACYVKSNNNVLLIYACIDNEGRDIRANLILIDHFLQTYSSRNVTLSFDFQDDDWNDSLYRVFGAIRTRSVSYLLDQRPWLVRWI